MIGIEFNEYFISSDYILHIVQSLKDMRVLGLLVDNKSQYIRILTPLNITKPEINIFIDKLKASFLLIPSYM
jgi:4-aminobutyrate aminotransferase-like enzyme